MLNAQKLAKPLSFTIRPSDSRNAKRGDANRCLLRCALRRYFPRTEVWVQVSGGGLAIIHIKTQNNARKELIVPKSVAEILYKWDHGAPPPTKPIRVRVTHEGFYSPVN